MNVVLVGWRQSSLSGSRGMMSAPDAFVSTVSPALMVASCMTSLAFVGKGYSLCTVNGAVGLSGTMMDSPLGMMYDDRLE